MMAATQQSTCPACEPTALTHLGVVEGLALERALLGEVTAGAIAADVRIWCSADRALVVPRSLAKGRRFARASAVLERLGYPVVVRESGGDVVPQAPGVCNVAVAFSSSPRATGGRLSVGAAYEVLCTPLAWWLRRQGVAADVGPVPGAFCDGRFNVTIGARKVAGTAQRWRQTPRGGQAVLAHAALMVDVDIDELVSVTNMFYRLCGLDRRCEVASHTTLAVALRDAGGGSLMLDARLQGLLTLYRDCLSPRAGPVLVTV
ncbi:lipoate--protein ligase family protein [Arhodomonas sp. AD133]|uniref:lipoate--protein ligase family protein n=1 Tax=Arhodomonas sp. AD133 TaxID=3415009 RepID=UPI003EBD84BC